MWTIESPSVNLLCAAYRCNKLLQFEYTIICTILLVAQVAIISINRQYIEREREVGAVTKGGKVKSSVSAKHNSSNTVCAALLLLWREQQKTEFIQGERGRGGYSNDGRQCGRHSDSTTQQQWHSACCFVTAVKGTAGDRIYRGREREIWVQ